MAGGDPAGGSAGLAKLIDQVGESLYWDFQHYLGLDLLDVARELPQFLTPRRALALIRRLPVESATIAELRGGEQFRGWGADRYLAASMVDAIRENTHAFISANSKSKPKPPPPVKRPGKEQKPKTDSKGNSFAAMAAQRISQVRKARGG